MEKIKLTKREYLGIGYRHEYKSLETDKDKFVCFTDKAEFDKKPEEIEGYKYMGSSGGFLMVDSPTFDLQLGSFTIINGIYVVPQKKENDFIISNKEMTEEEFNKKYLWQ